jgi:hypothetical protein
MQTTYRVHADELTSSPANRDHLLRAIENINNHKNLVEMSSDDL